jgi:hypothetical protein
MIRTTILAFFVLTAASAARAEDSPGSAAALLPRDGTLVDLMQAMFPKRLEELARKLQTAMAKDPAWLQSHIKTAKPGEPLPYHEKLGLTKTEYAEFLALTKKGGMQKVRSEKIKVQTSGDRVALLFGKNFPGMEKVEIDLKKDSASTPAGPAPDRELIRASQKQNTTGPWDGIMWKSTAFEEDPSRPSFSLSVGKLRASERGILYYRVRPGSANPAGAVEYVLYYDLPKSR